jgi:glucosamine-6-phosphate deaminase
MNMRAEFELLIHDTPAAAALRTAQFVADAVRAHPACVLGLATGRSMIEVYAQLVRAHRAGQMSFAGCTSFNLDEYCDLPAGHPSSFTSYMRRHLFNHVDFAPGHWHLPDGAGTPESADAFERAIRAAGGIDLQLLGVGLNGHIGFNEPGSAPASRTRKVGLVPSTRQANAPDFPADEAVPEAAVTMGIATILDARHIVLLATGAAKADALRRAFQGPVDPECPASILQRHDRVTVICDTAAASALRVDA